TDAAPSSGIAGFQCSLDGVAYSACNSGSQSYSSLADGTHTFDVKATDNAGNTDASPAHFSWLADRTPPVLTASAVKGTAPLFSGATPYTGNAWTNEDVKVTFSCSDAGGSGVAPGNPTLGSQTYSTEGEFTASSDCSDNAGNAAHTTFDVKIDKTAPTISATL